MGMTNLMTAYVKVKCTLVHALRLCTDRTAHRGSRSIGLLFLDHGTRRGEVSASRPGRSLPPGRTRYPLYRMLVGRKMSSLPGFDPRTVQPVAQSLYRLSYRPTKEYTRRMMLILYQGELKERIEQYRQCTVRIT